MRSTDKLGDMSFDEKVQKVQIDVPLLIEGINSHKPGLSAYLSDFANLIESIVTDAQNSANDSSVQYKRCVAALRSQVGALRDNEFQTETIKLTKVLEMVVTKIQQLSTHLN